MTEAKAEDTTAAARAAEDEEIKKQFKFLFWRQKKPEPVDPLALDKNKPVDTNILLEATLRTQVQTLEKIEQMEQHMASADELANEAGQTIAGDADTLNRVRGSVDAVAQLPEEATKITDTFVRTMFRDKCFLFLLGVVVILGIAAIITNWSVDTDADPITGGTNVTLEPAPNITNHTKSLTLVLPSINTTNGTNSSALAQLFEFLEV